MQYSIAKKVKKSKRVKIICCAQNSHTCNLPGVLPELNEAARMPLKLNRRDVSTSGETRKSKVYSGCALLTTELQYQTTFEKDSTKGIRLDVWAGDDKGTLRTFAVA